MPKLTKNLSYNAEAEEFIDNLCHEFLVQVHDHIIKADIEFDEDLLNLAFRIAAVKESFPTLFNSDEKRAILFKEFKMHEVDLKEYLEFFMQMAYTVYYKQYKLLEYDELLQVLGEDLRGYRDADMGI